jgi:hypothetical protein
MPHPPIMPAPPVNGEGETTWADDRAHVDVEAHVAQQPIFFGSDLVLSWYDVTKRRQRVRASSPEPVRRRR